MSSVQDSPQNIMCVWGWLTQNTDFTRNTFHYNYAIFSTVLLILRGYVALEKKAWLERQK